MNTRLLRLVALALSLAASLFGLVGQTYAQPAPDTGRPDSVLLHPSANPSGVAIRAAGAGYLSPITEAARPFTHLMLRWDATVPLTDGLHMEVRASLDGVAWTGWGDAPENPDLWEPADGRDTYWSQALYAGAGARFYQVRAIAIENPTGQEPVLRSVKVDTVDARFSKDEVRRMKVETPAQGAGGSDGSMQSSSFILHPSSLSKPGVISRTGWGCPDGQGSRVRPVYYPVNHMVVHHTADANTLSGSEQNWGDRVRAEWSFHTFSRGWGDVGYNFLIAPDGQVYEGRSGGDDAVAFHDTANYGSMGVVLIGTYAGAQPSAATQESLVSLLAWKADQKDIDPLGRSFYYGCSISQYCKPFAPGAIVENIAGHRQVTPGHTTCPGDAALGILPAIRNRVRERLLGGTSTEPPPPVDNGDLLIDELESGFARSNATWYEAACGSGGHTFYTYATDRAAQSSNSATWRPNIPAAGTYRVYAHIPQGCGLANTPYATTKAAYRIHTDAGDVTRTVDHNSGDEWADLGSYSFSAGTAGAVELRDLTGEPYSQRKVIFFDSVKWVPETSETTDVQLVNVAYDRTSVPAGELLKVTFTVRNNGTSAVRGQAPQSGTTPAGAFDVANGYAYDENECYLGSPDGAAPIFPKETSRVRVTLGALDRSPACAGNAAGYPWRWGLNGDLAPGQQQDIVGYVRFRNPGTVTLQAGVVQEYVRYYTQGASTTTITVTPERIVPVSAAYDELLRPLAQVYELGSIPDNFLARTTNPLSIPHGRYVGSFPWDGHTIDWGDGGPLGLSDGFIVQQTFVFRVNAAGSYTFRTVSDDGSWLWIDGVPVIVNAGLHSAGDADITGTLSLSEGAHVLAFSYFERTGEAVAGYSMRAPGSNIYTQPLDNLGGGAARLGATFTEPPQLTIAADDAGGSGVTSMRYSWDGSTWVESPGDVIVVGRLSNGSYTLRYQAIDAAGNAEPERQLSFTVNTNLRQYHMYLPLMGPPFDW